MNAEPQQQRPTKRYKTSDGCEDQISFIRELMAANRSFVSLQQKLPPQNVKGADKLHEKFKEATERLIAGYEEEMKELAEEAGEFLCNLDHREHDEVTVKRLIEAFPDALRYRHTPYDDSLYLPVQWLLGRSAHGFDFVPLLAAEGIRLKMFSEEEKGGISVIPTSDPFRRLLTTNVRLREFLYWTFCLSLSELTGVGFDECKAMLTKSNSELLPITTREAIDMHDERAKNVLQKLFELNILQKEDIIKYNLVASSAHHCSKKTFQFIVDFCPESLATNDRYDDLPIAALALLGNFEGFGMVLKAGIKYYPRKLGFLLRRSTEEDRIIDIAINSFNEKEVFTHIHEAIPPADEYPILHDVIRLAPKHFSMFFKYYPNAIYLRDKKGRLPLHIALQRAGKWSVPMLSLIALNDPINRHEKDPVNGLYPFMSAASGRGSDLNVIYYLLRRDPNVWEEFRASV